MGRQRQRMMDSTRVSRVTDGYGRQTEMEAAGCEIIGCACKTFEVKAQIDRERDTDN